MNIKFKSKITTYSVLILVCLILITIILKITVFSNKSISENKELAISKCIDACNLELSKGTIIEEGPCLSNEIVADWSCDIVHDPRVDWIDNKSANQCKNQKHFIEVNQSCELIKAE